jgi:molybdopterin-guanine dinucleotide biosynthesis protein A
MSVAAVILAGGDSRRMGQDKALLSMGKQTLLEHVEYQVRQVCDLVWLSRQPHQSVPESLTSLPQLHDTDQQLGPLAGIAAALAYALQQKSVSGLLVVPVDLPFVDSKVLSPLCQQGEAVQRPVCFGQHYMPLYLPVKLSIADFIHTQLNTDDSRKSVASVFFEFNGVQLPEPEGQSLTNTNTFSEWEFARSHWETLHG